MSNKQKKLYRARLRINSKYGLCSCGNQWIIRINKANKKEFLGCSNYPKCKNTKSL